MTIQHLQSLPLSFCHHSFFKKGANKREWNYTTSIPGNNMKPGWEAQSKKKGLRVLENKIQGPWNTKHNRGGRGGRWGHLRLFFGGSVDISRFRVVQTVSATAGSPQLKQTLLSIVRWLLPSLCLSLANVISGLRVDLKGYCLSTKCLWMLQGMVPFFVTCLLYLLLCCRCEVMNSIAARIGYEFYPSSGFPHSSKPILLKFFVSIYRWKRELNQQTTTNSAADLKTLIIRK